MATHHHHHYRRRWHAPLHGLRRSGQSSNSDMFIAMAKPAALLTKAKWGTPASVLIAQAALETGWGSHVKDGAYFGIKTGSRYVGRSTNFATHEVENGKSIGINDNFRAYDSFAEAADGYGEFLSSNPLFSGAFALKNDPYKFLSYIAKHYATKPSYEQEVRSIMNFHHLLSLDGVTETEVANR